MTEMSAGAMAELGRALTASETPSKSSEHTAMVSRIDPDGTPWVRILGGYDQTPIAETTISLEVGMVVKVTISGGRARVTGSTSAPSISTNKAQELMQPIADAARDAQSMLYGVKQDAEAASAAAASASVSASAAAEAAEQAVEDAGRAETAAYVAEIKADDAAAAAQVAYDEAIAAKGSAYTANIYAVSALNQLSEVENVVDTVNWIADHGTYTAATETSPAANRVYYERGGSGTAESPYTYTIVDSVPDTYVLTDDQSIVEGKAYYVPEYEYALTSDETIDPDKTYYTRSGDEGSYTYTEVSEPDVADIGSYYERSVSGYSLVAEPDIDDIGTYYERYAADPHAAGLYYLVIDESVHNYIASHLAQTDHGLDLLVDDTDFHMHIGTIDGSAPMGAYIIDGDGVAAAQFTATGAVIGKATGAMHVELTPNKLAFIDAMGNEAAYIETDTNTGFSVMYITRSVVVEDMQFGKWKWYSRANGNMALKWMGGMV